MRLQLRDIAKAYPGVQALAGLDLTIESGEVFGLVGENGAGKSTVLNIVSGVEQPDRGEILVGGEEVRLRDYGSANGAGIFRVFQEQATIPELRVYESLPLSHERLFRRAGVTLDRAKMVARGREALAEFGLEVDVRQRIGSLDVGMRQYLEIVRAVSLARLLEVPSPILLLDEPTTALDSSQDERLLSLIDRLRGTATVVFVSHRLEEVLRVCDRICVLKDGEKVADRPAEGLDEGVLHTLMVGRDRAANYYREDAQLSPAHDGTPVLHASEIAIDGEISPTSFDVFGGEVVGIGGLQGSGKSKLGQAVAGLLPDATGSVSVDGSPLIPPDFRRLMSHGLGWVAGDRHRDGLISDASILANMQLASLHDRLAPRGLWRRRDARREAEHWSEQLEIRPARIDAPAGTLSGGNQQKVVLAKWLCRDPRVLILENPTQGVDTGAREAIYDVIRGAAARGVGIVLITDDLTELIGLSDRVLIMVAGSIEAEFPAPAEAKPSEEELVATMSLNRSMVPA